MRKYYSDYVRHCARYYFSKELIPKPLEERVNYNNYISVANVLDRYSVEVFNMLKFIYTSEMIPRAVDKYASETGFKTEEIWYNIQRFERDVAVERGLL